MIFKPQLLRRGGNITTATALGVLGAITSFAILQTALSHLKLSSKNSDEAVILMDGHSLAGLLKKNIAEIYDKYLTDVAWAGCRVNSNPNEFVTMLSQSTPQAQNCSAVVVNFNDFKTVGANPTNQLALSALKTVDLEPSQPLNQFTHRLRITDFNTDKARNQLIATLTVTSPSNPVPKAVKVVIDVQRTVNPPARRATASICRNVAGAVCDDIVGGSSAIDLSFLDSVGNIRTLSSTGEVGETNQTPNPRAQSIKLPDEHTRIDYERDSFCISAISKTVPLSYIIDAANDADGNSYYLTTHGKLLRGSDGAEIWSEPDPKIVSIAFDYSNWWLLRSDGELLKTATIADPTTFTDSGLRVPTAERLTMGPGPAPCN